MVLFTARTLVRVCNDGMHVSSCSHASLSDSRACRVVVVVVGMIAV